MGRIADQKLATAVHHLDRRTRGRDRAACTRGRSAKSSLVPPADCFGSSAREDRGDANSAKPSSVSAARSRRLADISRSLRVGLRTYSRRWQSRSAFDPTISTPLPDLASCVPTRRVPRPTHNFWTSRVSPTSKPRWPTTLYSSDIVRGIGITPEERRSRSARARAELPASTHRRIRRHPAYRIRSPAFLQRHGTFEVPVREVVDVSSTASSTRGRRHRRGLRGLGGGSRVRRRTRLPQSSYRDLHRGRPAHHRADDEWKARHASIRVRVGCRAVREMLPYKQANPADDLLTDMAMATGEDATYSARDFIGMATSMLIAGNDTTANLLASAIYLFAKYPDERARLVDDPSLMGNAVEEILRYEPPVTAWHGCSRATPSSTKPRVEGDKCCCSSGGNRTSASSTTPKRRCGVGDHATPSSARRAL